jgi:hypothetical protein
MFGGGDHVVAEARVKGRFKTVDFPGQAGKAAPIQPGNHIEVREYTVIMRRLKDAHLLVEFVKFHKQIYNSFSAMTAKKIIV